MCHSSTFSKMLKYCKVITYALQTLFELRETRPVVDFFTRIIQQEHLQLHTFAVLFIALCCNLLEFNFALLILLSYTLAHAVCFLLIHFSSENGTLKFLRKSLEFQMHQSYFIVRIKRKKSYKTTKRKNIVYRFAGQVDNILNCVYIASNCKLVNVCVNQLFKLFLHCLAQIR